MMTTLATNRGAAPLMRHVVPLGLVPPQIHRAVPLREGRASYPQASRVCAWRQLLDMCVCRPNPPGEA
jgi:hypothetical protein